MCRHVQRYWSSEMSQCSANTGACNEPRQQACVAVGRDRAGAEYGRWGMNAAPATCMPASRVFYKTGRVLLNFRQTRVPVPRAIPIQPQQNGQSLRDRPAEGWVQRAAARSYVAATEWSFPRMLLSYGAGVEVVGVGGGKGGTCHVHRPSATPGRRRGMPPAGM